MINKNSIKGRILENLESGPKRYSELIQLEEDSIIGYKKHLRYKIEQLRRFSNDYPNECEVTLFLPVYKEFIKADIKETSMTEFRKSIPLSVRDFPTRGVHIGFSHILKELLESARIIKVKRGLYQLNKEI